MPAKPRASPRSPNRCPRLLFLCHSERSGVTPLSFAGAARVTSRSRGIPLLPHGVIPSKARDLLFPEQLVPSAVEESLPGLSPFLRIYSTFSILVLTVPASP